MYHSANHAKLLYEMWILYLRKSRQDDPTETVEEVLAKHEAILQEYAEREFGGRIPEENIYREVVSGESIDDRVEIKKVLARLEDPNVKGVLVVEPSRLSRGDLADCSRIINSFRFSKSQIVTPYMTYDLENKMERKFFKDELLRGNDYLEYTKEILFRGRVAAVKRGCYLGTRPPYGYDKTKIGKDYTLAIKEDEADVVRLIFDLYTREQLTPLRIAQRLNSMGIPAPLGGEWKKDTIRVVVRNPHYIGKVVWNRFKETQVLENGEITTKRLKQPEEEVIIAEGKHQAIIDMDTWEAARALVARNPRQKYTFPLKNPFSTMLFCGKCGRAMYIHPYKHAEDRFECKASAHGGRCYKSVKYSELYNSVLELLEGSELPELQLKVKNGDGNAVKIQQRRLANLEAQMKEFRDKEEYMYELLESRHYTPEEFTKRRAALRSKIEECENNIQSTRAAMPKSVNYAEQVKNLQAAIDALKDPEATPEQKNRLLKAVVERMVFKGCPPVDKSKGFKKGENDYTITVKLRH